MRMRVLALLVTGLLPLAACDTDGAEEMEELEPATTMEPPAFETLDLDGDSYLDADELAAWVDDEGVFTRWDIDADSELDADEINESVYMIWDADEDTVIVESEWETGVDHVYPGALDPGAFQDWDLDGDSELDADEVAEGLDATSWNEYWYEADAVIGFDEFMDMYFALWDRDGDGRIDAVEYETGAEYWVY